MLNSYFSALLSLSIGAACFIEAGSLSASTFAPTRTELDAMGHRHDHALAELPPPHVDESGRKYYEMGDMRFAADVVETDSAFTGRTWPGGVLYYQFDPAVTVTRRQQWREAAAVWAAVAPVSFIESLGSGNYVRVKASTRNSSFVGMIGGAQEMNIANWNSKFIIAHEIGHALGMIHEQSRSDRNSYVRVLFENIMSGEEHNFEIRQTSVLYGSYDFDSVMHYGRADFSSNGLNTLEPTPPYSSYLHTMGQTTHLSSADAAGMAQRYGSNFVRPPNDDFAARQAVSGHSGTTTVNTVAATKEPGEPNHAGNAGGASVWYSWTAASSGSTTIDTRGSNFDTTLHVWQGSAVSALASIASNDDIVLGEDVVSRVTFNAIAGQTYQIAVDGYDGESGTVQLNWQGPRARTSKADFNADGHADFVWQNTQNGERVLWFLRNGQYQSGIYLQTIAPEWRIASAADFNNDGHADFVWQNINNGERVIWFLRNGQYQSGMYLQTISREWEIASAADFNADGYADFVWQNTVTGERVMWFLRNGQYQSGIYLQTVAAEWRIAGAADFNDDGHADLAWQNLNTGERVMWFLRNGQFQSGLHLQTVAREWRIAAAGDFNGDGYGDFAWQNINTGERVIWFLRNGIYQSGLYLQTIDRAWDIADH